MNSPALDVVLPYVDSADPAWQDLFLKTRKKSFKTSAARNLYLKCFSTRYASYGMFRYWWRGYEQFGPPGKVHLLLQSESQIPQWLDRNHHRLCIHYHDEFMPANVLPTYNSSCIELCFLKKCASELSPFFLMMNDDFYFNAPSTFENFVSGDKPLTWAVVRQHRFLPTCLFRSVVCNNFNLVSKVAGKTCPHFAHNHLAVCYKRDAIIPALDKFWPTILPTLTRFRDSKNYNHWILRYWQDFTGVSHHSPLFPHKGYVEMPTATRESVNAIKNEPVICFNDTNGKFPSVVRDYLRTHFERKSSFELG